MKSKIYALALSLGIFSPLSCAMEQMPCAPYFCPANPNISFFPIPTYGPISFNVSYTPVSYTPVIPMPVPCPLPRIFGEKINAQNYIEYVNLQNDLTTYSSLQKFENMDNNTVVHTFVDFLGRYYNDIRLKSVISRCGALNYCACVNQTSEEISEMNNVFSELGDHYEKIYGSKFNNTKAKTYLIHFIEDVIYEPICEEKGCCYYNYLIACLKYFYYDENYKDDLITAWQNYLENVSGGAKLSKLTSADKEELKQSIDNYFKCLNDKRKK